MSTLTFSDETVGALEFTVTWEKDGIQHEEWFLGRKFNAVNDIFPRDMRQALEGKKPGESVTFTYEPRLCIPRHKPKEVRKLGRDRLRKKTLIGTDILPLVGRFYPQGHINGLKDIYPETLTPFRLVALNDESFTADCNHPLANIPVTIKATVQNVEKLETGTFGSLTHWREKTCDWGPGMQAMHEGQPTQFFHDKFFKQRDTGDSPVALPAIDDTAMDNIKDMQNRFLKQDMRVLDFSKDAPPMEGEYDAAICNLSIEYMVDPITTLKSVGQHLKPGGAILIAFSNKYDEAKVIQGWTELHEFEWMGLVLEYLRSTGLYENFGTISKRNDWRPQDDPLFLETRGVSDPVYMVYGFKA